MDDVVKYKGEISP